MGKPNRRKKGAAKRDSAFIDLNPVVLIVCEGEKTEPNYFRAINPRRETTSAHIEIIGEGEAPKSVVQHAKKKYREYKNDNWNISPENVWCVFDRDEHELFHEAIQMAKSNKFNAIFSVPSFELWYLLHFQDQAAHIERDQVIHELKKFIPDYRKNMKGIFKLLNEDSAASLDDAFQRAESLKTKHCGDGSPETCNPTTCVDILVKYLKSIK